MQDVEQGDLRGNTALSWEDLGAPEAGLDARDAGTDLRQTFSAMPRASDLRATQLGIASRDLGVWVSAVRLRDRGGFSSGFM